ncbi:MAG: lysine biosynthesis protein LysW [Planctomycetota bacterium]
MTEQNTAPCPECDCSITFDQPPLTSEITTCAECGVELEVTSIAPLRFAQAPEVEEDWGE